FGCECEPRSCCGRIGLIANSPVPFDIVNLVACQLVTLQPEDKSSTLLSNTFGFHLVLTPNLNKDVDGFGKGIEVITAEAANSDEPLRKSPWDLSKGHEASLSFQDLPDFSCSGRKDKIDHQPILLPTARSMIWLRALARLASQVSGHTIASAFSLPSCASDSNPGPQRSRVSAATRARWLTLSWLFRILSTPPGCWTSRIFPLAILTPNEFCRDQRPLHAKPRTVRIVLTGNIIPIDLEARPI